MGLAELGSALEESKSKDRSSSGWGNRGLGTQAAAGRAGSLC